MLRRVSGTGGAVYRNGSGIDDGEGRGGNDEELDAQARGDALKRGGSRERRPEDGNARLAGPERSVATENLKVHDDTTSTSKNATINAAAETEPSNHQRIPKTKAQNTESDVVVSFAGGGREYKGRIGIGRGTIKGAHSRGKSRDGRTGTREMTREKERERRRARKRDEKASVSRNRSTMRSQSKEHASCRSGSLRRPLASKNRKGLKDGVAMSAQKVLRARSHQRDGLKGGHADDHNDDDDDDDDDELENANDELRSEMIQYYTTNNQRNKILTSNKTQNPSMSIPSTRQSSEPKGSPTSLASTLIEKFALDLSMDDGPAVNTSTRASIAEPDATSAGVMSTATTPSLSPTARRKKPNASAVERAWRRQNWRRREMELSSANDITNGKNTSGRTFSNKNNDDESADRPQEKKKNDVTTSAGASGIRRNHTGDGNGTNDGYDAYDTYEFVPAPRAGLSASKLAAGGSRVGYLVIDGIGAGPGTGTGTGTGTTTDVGIGTENRESGDSTSHANTLRSTAANSNTADAATLHSLPTSTSQSGATIPAKHGFVNTHNALGTVTKTKTDSTNTSTAKPPSSLSIKDTTSTTRPTSPPANQPILLPAPTPYSSFLDDLHLNTNNTIHPSHPSHPWNLYIDKHHHHTTETIDTIEVGDLDDLEDLENDISADDTADAYDEEDENSEGYWGADYPDEEDVEGEGEEDEEVGSEDDEYNDGNDGYD